MSRRHSPHGSRDSRGNSRRSDFSFQQCRETENLRRSEMSGHRQERKRQAIDSTDTVKYDAWRGSETKIKQGKRRHSSSSSGSNSSSACTATAKFKNKNTPVQRSRSLQRSLSPELKRNRTQSRKRRRSSSSSSTSSSSGSSSSDSDAEERHKRKERKKQKKEAKRLKKAKKKEKKLKKKMKKEKKRKAKAVPAPALTSPSHTEKALHLPPNVPLGPVPGPPIPELSERAMAMKPMTKEEWDKRQSVVRKVYDEETGRHRLIKGDGEVLEEIVSRDRHREINRQATQGDGNFFQAHLSAKVRR